MQLAPRIDAHLLREMAARLSPEDCAEMAIPSYLHKNPFLRAMAWWRVALLAERLTRAARAKGRSDLRIVDFGCGSGVLFADAREVGSEIIGVDLVLDAARLLVERRGYRNVRLLTPSEASAAVEPASVDIVLAGEVLEHVEPIDETLQLFARWLRPEGQLLVTLPTENALYQLGRRLAGFKGHYHHANAAKITEDLLRCGFRVTHKSAIPLPGPLSVYWCLDLTPATVR